MIYKAAGAELDYPIQWKLDDGVTIAASAWSAAPAGLTLENPVIEGAATAVTVKGGAPGTVYRLLNTVTLSTGHKDVAEIALRVTAALPITMEEAKDFLSIERDLTVEDAMIERLIAAAVERIETVTRVLGVSRARAYSFRAPDAACELALPERPVSAVTAVEVASPEALDWQPFTGFRLVDGARRPRLRPAPGESWPQALAEPDAFRVTATVGHATTAEIPERWQLAVLMLVKHWYDRRDFVSDMGERPVPEHVRALIQSLTDPAL